MCRDGQAIKHYASSADVDVSKLFISGGSAGGQLALALSIKLIEQGFELCGLVVLCPISVGPSAVPSALKHKYLALEENSDGPLVDASLYMRFISKLLLGNLFDETFLIAPFV